MRIFVIPQRGRRLIYLKDGPGRDDYTRHAEGKKRETDELRGLRERPFFCPWPW
jgi:hypothetical protein